MTTNPSEANEEPTVLSPSLSLVPRSLDELAERIRTEHRRAMESMADVVAHAIAAGEALLEARGLVQHGHWEQWMAENVSEINAGNHRIYMRMARHRDLLLQANPPTLREARRLIANERDTRVDPTLIAEVQRLRSEGTTIKDIAEEVGINKSAAWRYLNPAKDRQLKREYARKHAAQRRAWLRQERDSLARRAGGQLAEAYSLVRKALQELDRALEDERNREAKLAAASAISKLHHAEDQIAAALKTTDREAA